MTTLIAVISGVVAVIVAVVGGYITLRQGRQAGTSSPYTELAARVTALEANDAAKTTQIMELHRTLIAVTEDRDLLVAYVRRWWAWALSGAKPPPPPVPDHLADVLPPGDFIWPPADPT